MKAKLSKTTLLHRIERRLGWIAPAAFLLVDTPALSLRRAAASPWDWTTASPESQGVSKAKLDALRESVAERKTKALLVIRNDRIVCEWYAPGHGTNRPHGTASMAKAIVGGLSLAVALTDDSIALDDPAARFVLQWKHDPRKARITIRQLGSHTSGLEDAEAEGLSHEQLTGWKGDFWKRLNPPDDPFTISRDRTPALFDPGEELHYSNPGIAMLTWCVTAALRDKPHKDIRTLLRERVMRPIGVRDDEWSVGYGKTCTLDGLPLVASWGGGSYTARAVARIGRLILRHGDWDGKSLLSREAVRQMVGDAGLPGNCGMGWWNNAAGRYPKLPKDAAWGAGAGDQLLLVIPSLNLILVRNGDTLAPPPADAADVLQKFHDPRVKILFEPLVDAITDRPEGGNKIAPGTAGRTGASRTAAEARGLEVAAALPPNSPVIQRIKWAPTNTIRRAARGSDRFPLTWADDNAQYTAWGDGWGFGGTSEKLSLGYARVAGAADGFGGVDVRSTSGEAFGEGSRGFKASGMLSVGGVLYLWAGNANMKTGTHSRLAWSPDHARTWTWADWEFEEFGYISLVNFGGDYAGARDSFVYGVAHDAPSGRVFADHFVLMRARKDRLRERGAYEFFVHTDKDGAPIWTRNIAQRGAVFTHQANCLRQQMTYCAPLKRYLWWQQLPNRAKPGDHGDTRFEGGFGIYDAPEPWGPWTTAYFTEKWDIGPGETACFPAKWMSADGKTLHLVFSGDDSFSVRKATLVLFDTSTKSAKSGGELDHAALRRSSASPPHSGGPQ